MFSGLGKSVVFRLYHRDCRLPKGTDVTGGADGVGRATTSAVVTASISVLVGGLFSDQAADSDLMSLDSRPPFIEIRGLYKSFGSKAVLQGLDLEVFRARRW